MVTPLKLRKRTSIFFFALMGALLVLAGHIGWIQVVEGHKMSARIQEQLQYHEPFFSPRGTIYDRSGRELAVSNLVKSLYANPEEIKDADLLAKQLAAILGKEEAEIKEALTGPGQFAWISRKIEPEQHRAILALIKENNIPGLHFQEESKRYYPNKFMLAQVLGFVGTDDKGLEGLEASLDNEIKGQSFKQPLNTDNQGVPILESVFSYTPRGEQISVYLTIDSVIQYITEKALDKAMQETKARAATVIVMNPKTGEILAMANRPAYDPNNFGNYNPSIWKNTSVGLNYEPGSTFKAIIAAAALEEGVVTAESRFFDKGYIEVLDRKIKNWSDRSYGSLSFVDVMKDSINTSFVEIGLRMGGVKLTDYAQRFGFGKPTGIELYGEESGLLFEPREMRQTDTATMAIGQSIAVTPIQLVCAFSAIANKGLLPKPFIIKEYRSSSDKTPPKVFREEFVRRVIKPETAKTLIAIMEKVISEGGASNAKVAGYRFAGKTGTAERIKESGYGYEAGHYIASFAGFGPVEDPQFAAVVVLDDPVGVYYGGQIAAPVFSEIMSQIMIYANVQSKEKMAVLEKTAAQNASQDLGQPLAPPQNGRTQVPDLTGESLKSAGEILSQQELKFIPQGDGIAVMQSIRPYEKVDTGTEVIVYFEQR
ncbi:MAG: PASTA domain-containing protein [Sporomusaceae bacterium]|jgi:cell division protein FtsI/penicillin-binding protein 2|nr:PASTA domain-containing protein [Sporomusaceae bacterium]